MAPITTCPPREQWQLLLDSQMTDGQSTVLQEHLHQCASCRTTLDDLAVGNSGWLRDAQRLAQATDEPELTATLNRIRDLDIDSSDDSAGPMQRVKVDFLQPSTTPGTIGMLGRYTIIEIIGQGGFGVVLKAIDPDLLRPVAIKVMLPHLANNGTARKRFIREARAAAAISHDHVVTIHAVDQHEGLPYIVMEYVSGLSLQERLSSHGPLEATDVARIGIQVANGLAAAHRQGLIHRDIKPANIMLDGGLERVKITDFGLARAHDEATLTQSGIIAGTPLYMSPEQARGDLLDPRSDLFSLGSVLYTMCAGYPPFRGSNAMGVLHRINNNQPHPVRSVNPDIPVWLEEIVMKLLEKDPAKRYARAEEVAEVLLASLNNPPAPKKPRNRRWLWAAAGLVSAAIIMGGVILTFKTPEGTLEVAVDDPSIKVTLDQRELVINGAGPQEIRLKPGNYRVMATQKDGQTVYDKVLTIKKDSREIVSVTAKPSDTPLRGQMALQDPFKMKGFEEDQIARWMAEYSKLAGGGMQFPPIARDVLVTPPGQKMVIVDTSDAQAAMLARLQELRTQIGVGLPQLQISMAQLQKLRSQDAKAEGVEEKGKQLLEKITQQIKVLEEQMAAFKALYSEVEKGTTNALPPAKSIFVPGKESIIVPGKDGSIFVPTIPGTPPKAPKAPRAPGAPTPPAKSVEVPNVPKK